MAKHEGTRFSGNTGGRMSSSGPKRKIPKWRPPKVKKIAPPHPKS